MSLMRTLEDVEVMIEAVAIVVVVAAVMVEGAVVEATIVVVAAVMVAVMIVDQEEAGNWKIISPRTNRI